TVLLFLPRLSGKVHGVSPSHQLDTGRAKMKEIKMNTATNKVALVTGASRGIGAAIAERLAADGFTVVINYAGSAGDAEALAGKIEKAGGRAAVARMFDAADAAFGGVDVLVNNAGIMHLASIAESDDRLFDSHVAIN